jgi:DNA-binding transcriptional LysR family regulator
VEPIDLQPRHLRVLVALERHGSMRAVAAATGYSTSAVSAQLAALERDAGVALLERDGRRVRLTHAGQRLAVHARTILAAADAARADLAADAPVAGRVRVAAYASALARDCLIVTCELGETHPGLEVELEEREPDEALALLEDGDVDVAFVYDYSLAPRPARPGVELRELCTTPMMLALPQALAEPATVRGAADLAVLAEEGWIVNSRGREDDELIARVAARAGFVPRVRHRADALDVVMTLVGAGLGVALIPASVAPQPGVRLVELGAVAATRRMLVATRPGHAAWPPVALITSRVAAHAQAADAAAGGGA